MPTRSHDTPVGRLIRRTSTAAIVGLWAILGSPASGAAQEAGATPGTSGDWIVTASEAVDRLRGPARPPPTVLDARSGASFLLGHVQGARRVDWADFTPSERRNRGKLLEDADRLEARLRELGVWRDRPVLVYGDPRRGWGEEGRIVWMLRSLGHDRTAMVDGGYEALKEAGASIARGRGGRVAPGDFRVERTDAHTVGRDAVRQAMDDPDVVIVDTRERREYEGATPYGEPRGGHVPGAVHIHYRELLEDDGRLLPPARIREELEHRGVTRDVTVHAYCTGGVRSGWMVAVLEQLGYQAKNYAGSMWEWAGAPAETHPLE